MSPELSVCIPSYNRYCFKETPESVFAQAYNGYEVVIVHDGSTDGTREMRPACGYPVRYYWQPKQAVAALENKLIDSAGWYVNHQTERKKIAGAAMKWVPEQFNCVKMAGYILDVIERGIYSAPWLRAP